MTATVSLSGYVSRFDTADRSGDVVRRGAFLGGAVQVPFLWQHDVSRPIGRVVSLVEDAIGLRMEAEIAEGARDGGDAVRLLLSGAVDGLSFGYRVRSARKLPGGGREIRKLDLVECSLVTLPMHPDARVTTVGGKILKEKVHGV